MLDMVPFTVQTLDFGLGRRLMAMCGDLDITAADTAWQHVDEALTPGAILTVDVSRLGLLDSSGLRFLLLARREAETRGATLRLLNPRPWLRERLRLGGVMHLFDVRYSGVSTSQRTDYPDTEISRRLPDFGC